MLIKPKIKINKVIAKSRLFRIEEIHLQFSNGQNRIYERLSPARYNAVMIVPMLDKDTIILIREYGVGVEDYTLGFPKGVIEQGEELFIGANRELMEETGKGAKKYTYLRDLMLSPNYMQHKLALVVAEDLYDERLIGDEPEPLEIISWNLNNIDALLEQDDFIESRSITALLLIWKNWIKQQTL